MTDMEAHKIWT